MAPIKLVWNVFYVVGNCFSGQHIGTYCSKGLAYSCALKGQLKQMDKCYIAWTHENEHADNRLRLIHKDILNDDKRRIIEPMYIVQPRPWYPTTYITPCSKCAICPTKLMQCLR